MNVQNEIPNKQLIACEWMSRERRENKPNRTAMKFNFFSTSFSLSLAHIHITLVKMLHAHERVVKKREREKESGVAKAKGRNFIPSWVCVSRMCSVNPTSVRIFRILQIVLKIVEWERRRRREKKMREREKTRRWRFTLLCFIFMHIWCKCTTLIWRVFFSLFPSLRRLASLSCVCACKQAIKNRCHITS